MTQYIALRTIHLKGRPCGWCLTGTLYAIGGLPTEDPKSKVACWKCKTEYYTWQSVAADCDSQTFETLKITRYCRGLRPDQGEIRRAIDNGIMTRAARIPEASNARMWTAAEQDNLHLAPGQAVPKPDPKQEEEQPDFDWEGEWWHHGASSRGYEHTYSSEFREHFSSSYPWGDGNNSHVIVLRKKWEPWEGEEAQVT